ncbi:MAG: HEAT repeat domain-containing protein, partial [Planctomycetota bacterium]|nr:HEAT repeat domain-containing protein [Planctomycetota bacterium]
MNRSLWTPLGALLIAASLPACQSGAGAAKKPPVENRKRLGDLPESYSKLWKAWLLKDSRYPMLREAALADPDTTRFLVENLIGVVLGELSSGRVLSGPPGQPTSLERARLELVDLGAASTHALSEVLVLGSGLGPVAVEDLLVEIGGPSVDPLLAQLARKDSPVARRRASRTLGEIAFQRIPANMTTEVVRTALAECLENDEDWIVRSQSALALASWGRSTPSDMADCSRPIVRALADEDDGVRKDVLQALGRLGDPRTIPALVNHLERCMNGGRMGEIVLAQKCL